MSDFTTYAPGRQLLDPLKRVRYSMGLVLGVDEFEQEQTYLMARDSEHNRLLHGYGTVCGLQVWQDEVDEGPRILVEPGVAVNPIGQVIRVPRTQCAELNEWLNSHREEVTDQLGGPPQAGEANTLTLYVVLCYRECETDTVPVPGGPCRSEDDSMTASRIEDAFAISLTFEAPAQLEANTVGRLADLLSLVEITDAPGTFTNAEDMADLVRALAAADPDPATEIRLRPEEAESILHIAYVVWVTEVRPQLMDGGCNGPAQEDCVLLAGLTFGIDTSFQVDVAIDIGETTRPLLLSNRLLQEWLTSFGGGESADDHGVLNGLGDDDHRQYLLVDPGTRALITDLNADGNSITGLAPATANGQAVPFQQAVKVNDTAGGDLDGNFANLRVRALQGRAVLDTDPDPGDVLTWNDADSRWEPQEPPGGGPAPNSVEKVGTTPYFIIAAGHFRVRGEESASLHPAYNELEMLSRAPVGDYLLQFNGYSNNDDLTYIVKGTVGGLERGQTAVFMFVGRQNNGIRVRVTTPGGEPLEEFEVMIEISRFGEVSG